MRLKKKKEKTWVFSYCSELCSRHNNWLKAQKHYWFTIALEYYYSALSIYWCVCGVVTLLPQKACCSFLPQLRIHISTQCGEIFPNEVYSIARGRRSREAKYNDQNLSDIQSCSLSLSTMMLCDDFRLG